MNLTPEMITATSGLVVAVLGSIGTLYVAIQNGRKTMAAAKVADDAAKAAVATAAESRAKVEEVHVLVNGGLTEQKVEIARLSKIIAELTGAKGDENHAEVTADQAKDSVKLSADMMKKLPNG